jgi:DNA-binding protein HU-beta
MNTKPELIAAIAGDSGQTKLATTAVLESIENIVATTLKAGGVINLPGIGKLSVKDTGARIGRNPATGAPVNIAAGRKVVFKAVKSLKDAI